MVEGQDTGLTPGTPSNYMSSSNITSDAHKKIQFPQEKSRESSSNPKAPLMREGALPLLPRRYRHLAKKSPERLFQVLLMDATIAVGRLFICSETGLQAALPLAYALDRLLSDAPNCEP